MHRPARKPLVRLSLAALLCVGLVTVPGVARGEETLRRPAQRNVPVTMRDGVVLRADVHRPDRGGPYPVLVLRTPYGKGGPGRFDRYVKAGYIVVAQDARGRYASDGKWESFVRGSRRTTPRTATTRSNGRPGLPGSTGKVGTFGGSYNAFSPVAAGGRCVRRRWWPCRPTASRPATPTWKGPARSGPGGGCAGGSGHDPTCAAGPTGPARTRRPRREAVGQGSGPEVALLPAVAGSAAGGLRGRSRAGPRLAQTSADRSLEAGRGCPRVTVPNLDVVGWYDHCNGQLLLTKRWAKKRNRGGPQRIPDVDRPLGHSGRGGGRATSTSARPPTWTSSPSTSAGSTTGSRARPTASTRVARSHLRHGRQPLARRTSGRCSARENVLFLAGGGQANTPAGDGVLVAESRRPMAGTHTATTRPIRSRRCTDRRCSAAADQRPLANRQDILVYQTPPTSAVEVTGLPRWNSMPPSAPDTDCFVRLIDVAPDGLARDVSLGMVLRDRETASKPRTCSSREKS